MKAFLAAAAVCVLSGMGVGGGTLLMIYLTVFAKTGQPEAQGINLVYFLPTSAASLVLHIKNRLVDARAFAFAAPAGMLAAAAAGFAANSMDPEVLRTVFGAVLVCAGLWQIFGKRPCNSEGKKI